MTTHARGARLWAISALAVVLSVGASACAAGDDTGVADEPRVAEPSPLEPAPGSAEPAPGATKPPTAVNEVAIQGFRFVPARLEVPAGATVTWTNEDTVAHTVTAGTASSPTEAFRLELGGQAQNSRRFDEPGTHPYFCDIHPSMTGEIVVAP